jgi:uncharacterized membrane protein YtjA (UPF0391 family)
MVRLALIFLAIAIVAGILGFVVNIAGAIAKILFFVFLIAAAASFAPKLLHRPKTGDRA